MRIKIRLIFLALVGLCTALISPAQQAAPLSPDHCQQFTPYGLPHMTVPAPVLTRKLVCRNAYVLTSDLVAKVPVWVAYTLTPEHAVGCVPRSNAFAADQSLEKTERADPRDYVGGGYDIGHQAPDGDMSWDSQVEHESFLLTNMAPQTPHLNRGIWKLLESDVRAWAKERGDTLLIYDGPVYNMATDKTIGDDKVDVPTQFYKIVIDTKTGEVISFLFPAAGIDGNDLTSLIVPEAKVEAATGIAFPLPSNAKETGLWPVDLGAFTKAKKALCGSSGATD